MMFKKTIYVLFILFFSLSVSTGAWAVVVGPDILGVDFRFNNPGARANAMGGPLSDWQTMPRLLTQTRQVLPS